MVIFRAGDLLGDHPTLIVRPQRDERKSGSTALVQTSLGFRADGASVLRPICKPTHKSHKSLFHGRMQKKPGLFIGRVRTYSARTGRTPSDEADLRRLPSPPPRTPRPMQAGARWQNIARREYVHVPALPPLPTRLQ